MPCDLDQIKVLYRDRNCQLWGIPYRMRPGQSPMHLWNARAVNQNINLDDWRWLGTLGWYGSMTKDEQEQTKAFLTPLRDAGWLPGNPHEWVDLAEAARQEQTERDQAVLDFLTA